MIDFSETIVAPITGQQRAPVALIRVSGDKSWEIAKKLFPAAGHDPNRAYFGHIVSGGEKLDEGYLTLFEKGRSYTEEESFEVSCHGSPEAVRRIVAAIVDLGARAARPGEFTERAFLNGRIDLTRAEAVRETIDAATEAQRLRATQLRAGRLAAEVNGIQVLVGTELARAEATVDFSEEIGDLDRNSARANLGQAVAGIDKLLSGYQASRLIREGLRVAIVGRPNVGKSSLLNALLGSDRAIVTDIPGTTRDTIEETASIAGYPVVLTDTAGLRVAYDAVERIGVERSRATIDASDQVWFVYEAPAGWTSNDEALAESLGRPPDLLIANKTDLGKAKLLPASVMVSATSGTGLEALEHHVEGTFDVGEGLALVNERHREDLVAARIQVEQARDTLSTDLPTDLACVDLYGAMQTLGRITGETAPDEIIERVFRDFCIGK
ncbi:MAG: tRNA uridine-5-carboxymethylaminomethyl(34) synthesis GTPase MnmE [Armatimonadetes bacterium]|nr:tRNA uridine-5-carboxymethylaminomethyl(34) synthesis GTPase MnmE [Armatimonadota bacterium]